MTSIAPLSRRSFLKTTASGLAAAGLSAAPFITGAGRALAAEPINFATWSAAVDTVKSHLAAFEAKTGIKVNYSNSPWAQYRETMITKFIGKAPVDTLWVSDSWLPEWADAGWIAAGRSVQVADRQFRRRPVLRRLDDLQGQAVRQHLLQRLHGLHLQRRHAGQGRHQGAAGRPGPRSSTRAKIIKDKGLAQWPVLISMAQESWLIEFMTAMVYLQWRPFHRRQGQCGDAGSGERRRARAALAGRRRAEAQDPVAVLRRDR